ncbi:MAG: hypothetical protein H7Y88_09345 [Phycisphaerales bacterium]|nr:hypothetical protein [Phycisphaerales bacterium]
MNATLKIIIRCGFAGLLALGAVGCEQKGSNGGGSDNGGSSGKPPTTVTPSQQEPAPNPSGHEDPTTVDDQSQETLTGFLRGGMSGVGGEHTGWQLEREGQPHVEVDAKPIVDQVKPFDGPRVTLTGKFNDKKYVERGMVRIFTAVSIKAAE